jgi:hypothetical protein
MKNLLTPEESTLYLEQTAFSITFSWQESNVTVKLDKGEDVLKLGKIFSDFLTNNGISNTIINNE